MKKMLILLALLSLFFFSCKDMFHTAGDKTAELHFRITLPKGFAPEEMTRFIHPDSLTAEITLTYPDGGEPLVDVKPLLTDPTEQTSTAGLVVTDLDIADDVELVVALKSASGLVLCSGTETIDLKGGINYVSITLAAETHDVTGLLTDHAGAPVPNQAMTVNGATLTTDASGAFTIPGVSTEDWETEIYTFSFSYDGTANTRSYSAKTLLERSPGFTLQALESEAFVFTLAGETHSAATQGQVSLTYPDDTLLTRSFAYVPGTTLSYDWVDIAPADGVEAEVTLGTAGGTVLSRGSATVDIAAKSGTAAVSLSYESHDVALSILGTDDGVLTNFSYTFKGSAYTTGADGVSTLSVSSSEWSQTLLFAFDYLDYHYEYGYTGQELIEGAGTFSLPIALEDHIPYDLTVSYSGTAHPDARWAQITVTTPAETIEQGLFFPFDGGSHTLEDLKVAGTAIVNLSLYDGVGGTELANGTGVSSISSPENTAVCSLGYRTYRVSGVLNNYDGTTYTPVVGSTEVWGFYLNGDTDTPFTVSDLGEFTLPDMTTENWDDEYVLFTVELNNESTLHFSRTKKDIIKASPFSLTMWEEVFIDLTVSGSSGPIEGIELLIGGETLIGTEGVFSDAQGRILYGPVQESAQYSGDFGGEITLYDPEGFYLPHNFTDDSGYYGSPGALTAPLVEDVVLADPVFLTVNHALNGWQLLRLDYDEAFTVSGDAFTLPGFNYSNTTLGGSTLTGYDSYYGLSGAPLNLTALLANDTNYSGLSNWNDDQGVVAHTDYEGERVFLMASYDRFYDVDVSYLFQVLWVLDGLSDTAPEYFVIPEDTFAIANEYLINSEMTDTMGYSVTQMLLSQDGNTLYCATTLGVLALDISAADPADWTVSQVWEANLGTTPNREIFVANGLMETAGGDLIALGAKSLEAGDPTPLTQQIWRLNPDGTLDAAPTDLALTTAAAYDELVFATGNGPVMDNTIDYLWGLHPLGTEVLTLLPQDGSWSSSGGLILPMDGAAWSAGDTDTVPSSSASTLFMPLGVLPDNRFYLIDVNGSNNEQRLLRMGADRVLEEKIFLSEPSGAGFFYYFDNPFNPGV